MQIWAEYLRCRSTLSLFGGNAFTKIVNDKVIGVKEDQNAWTIMYPDQT